jgi:cobalt-zinc-cadmium efflux system protein
MHLEVPGHSHSHSHPHGAHDLPSAGALAGSVAASVLLVLVELVGGILGHSIALVSDAAHQLTDIPSILIAWLAMRWSSRPADADKTFGYHRTGILAAFVNAIVLFAVSGFLFYEAWRRFKTPSPVETGIMVVVSLVALGVNGGITLAVVRGRRDLNMRAVFIHNLGDALSNIGVLAGALIIRSTGAQWIDPLLGAAIGAMVLWSSFGILREASHILLEGLPRGMELSAVAHTILASPGVEEVHDIHIWTLGTDLYSLSCHVCIPDMHMEQSEKILQDIKRRLAEEFHITHTTIQFERAGLPRATRFYMPEPFRPES